MSRSHQWKREGSVPFQLLQNEFVRFIENYLHSPNQGGSGQEVDETEAPETWSPPLDVYETPEETVVLVEIPGIDPAQVELSVTGNLLLVQGTKPLDDRAETSLQLRERRFGNFSRQVPLTAQVDFDAAQAEAHNGVLTIRLPKRRAEKPRTIPIRPS